MSTKSLPTHSEVSFRRAIALQSRVPWANFLTKVKRRPLPDDSFVNLTYTLSPENEFEQVALIGGGSGMYGLNPFFLSRQVLILS
jgi:hypothetical protein